MSYRPWWNLEPCGTVAAYRRHERQHERPCEPCREAHRRYNRVLMQERRRAQAEAFQAQAEAFRQAEAEAAYRAAAGAWRAEHAESLRRQRENALRTLVALLAEALAEDARERRRSRAA